MRFEDLTEDHKLAMVTLGELASSYGAGFRKVAAAPASAPIPLSYKYNHPDSEKGKAITALHREVWGEGPSANEAVKDWSSKLDREPQAGDFLYWRVKPEIKFEYDYYATKKLNWRVYSLFAIA